MHKGKYVSFFENSNQLFVVLLWCCGLFFGVILAAEGQGLLRLLYNTCSMRASFFSLLLHCLVPFLISVLSVRWKKPWLIFVVCFTKALLLGVCTCWIVCCFHQASWIVLSLLLFSDLAFTPAIIYFWLQYIGATSFSIYKCFPYCMIAAIIVLFDYCYVSPFLITIFNNL